MMTDFLSNDAELSNDKLPFSVNEISFIGWLGDLDGEDDAEALISALSVLKKLKQRSIEAELRLFFLQKLSTKIEQLSQQLQQSYIKSLFPFSKLDKLKLELSALCAKEMAQNYKVLCESKDFKSKTTYTPQQKASIVFDGIQFQGKQLLYTSMMYQKPEEGFWNLCYLFYLFAKQNDVLELEMDFSQTCFLNAFKQLLLFQLSNVQQFNTEELLAIYELLNKCSQQTRLINEVPEKKFRGIPYINLRVDDAPSLPKDNMLQQPYLFYISCLDVIKVLLESSTNKGVLGNCNKPTLLRLVKALTMNQQRKSNRDNVDDQLYAIIGFDNIRRYLLGINKTKYDRAKLAPGEVRDLNFNIASVDAKQINPEDFRSEREANLTIATESFTLDPIDNADIWITKKQKAKQKAKKPQANIGLFDKSASGYGLRLKEGATKVGDIIAIRIAEGLVLTVVRRILQIKEDEIQVGVEVLGNDAEILDVSDTSAKPAVIVLYFKTEDEVENIIIGTNDYHDATHLFADGDGKKVRFAVEKQLNMSSTFRHLKVSEC